MIESDVTDAELSEMLSALRVFRGSASTIAMVVSRVGVAAAFADPKHAERLSTLLLMLPSVTFVAIRVGEALKAVRAAGADAPQSMLMESGE